MEGEVRSLPGISVQSRRNKQAQDPKWGFLCSQWETLRVGEAEQAHGGFQK